MNYIFEIATEFSRPLALSGLFAAILFFILRQILAKEIFPKLAQTASADIIKIIVNRLFVLAFFAMILGFIGYMLPYVINENNSDDAILVHLSGLVIDEEGKPVRKVMITVDGKRFKAVSASDGKYADSFNLKELNASVTVRAHNKNYYTFETVEKIPNKEHVLNIVLNKK